MLVFGSDLATEPVLAELIEDEHVLDGLDLIRDDPHVRFLREIDFEKFLSPGATPEERGPYRDRFAARLLLSDLAWEHGRTIQETALENEIRYRVEQAGRPWPERGLYRLSADEERDVFRRRDPGEWLGHVRTGLFGEEQLPGLNPLAGACGHGQRCAEPG